MVAGSSPVIVPMEEEVLSLEQMKELSLLGIDTSDANMFYITFWNKKNKPWKVTTRSYMEFVTHLQNVVHNPAKRKNKMYYMNFHPTYTLQELLNKIPGKYELLKSINGIWMEYCLDDETAHYIKTCGNNELTSAFNMIKELKKENII